MATGTWQNTRYSSLDEIDRTNAGRLKLAWTFSNGVFKGQEAAPVVVGSRMYVVSPFPNVLYAIDLARSSSIPIYIFSLREKGNIKRALIGEDIGSIVTDEI